MYGQRLTTVKRVVLNSHDCENKSQVLFAGQKCVFVLIGTYLALIAVIKFMFH